MRTVRFEYFHDPLCGWCYASAPALQALSEAYPEQLNLLSSGLFAGRGARALTPDWAQYAWKNDQYISSVTGQVFSTEYKDKTCILTFIHMHFLVNPTFQFIISEIV